MFVIFLSKNIYFFSMRTLTHAAAQTTWREERDAPFVAGNTVIILSFEPACGHIIPPAEMRTCIVDETGGCKPGKERFG